MLGNLDPLRNLPDAASQQALLDQLRRAVPDYDWLAIARNGRLMVQSGERLGHDGDGRIPTENAGAMVLKHPVPGVGGGASSVILAELGWNWIRNIQANDLTPDDDGEVNRQLYLIDSSGVVMAGPAGMVGNTLTMPVIDRTRAGVASWSREQWPDGAYLTGAALATGEGQNPGPGSQAMNWIVLVRQNVDKSLYILSNLRLDVLALALALVLALLFLPVGWLLASRLTTPLRHIADYADRLRQGDDVQIPRLRGVLEIEILSDSLRAMVASLTNKEQELAEMETRATHDPLTGLYNRAGLQRWLQHAMPRCRREDAGILMLVGDLDGFKAVNDRLGHPAGDRLLRLVAARLSNYVRASDAVARLGGDEFVLAVVAHRHDAGEAQAIAQRALEHVTTPYDLDGQQADIGITLGAALWPDQHPEIGQILQMADRALYAGKRAGRRRIVFYRDSEKPDMQ